MDASWDVILIIFGSGLHHFHRRNLSWADSLQLLEMIYSFPGDRSRLILTWIHLLFLKRHQLHLVQAMYTVHLLQLLLKICQLHLYLVQAMYTHQDVHGHCQLCHPVVLPVHGTDMDQTIMHHWSHTQNIKEEGMSWLVFSDNLSCTLIHHLHQYITRV